jgi:hypothetical protein
MKLSINDFDFLDSFDHLGEHCLDPHNKNKVNLFSLKINANDFDYKGLQDNLLEPIRNKMDSHFNAVSPLNVLCIRQLMHRTELNG